MPFVEKHTGEGPESGSPSMQVNDMLLSNSSRHVMCRFHFCIL